MRRKVLLAVSLLILGAFPVAPAASSHGTGGDCGGADTPPAYTLTSGVTCAGDLNEPATTTVDRTEMGYRESKFVDRFDVAATDGDQVQITSSSHVCFTKDPSGTFIASGNGNIGITVTARQTFELGSSSPKMPCPDEPGQYTIRATVTPNDRPNSVTASGVPASVGVGQSYTFTVSGTDPDGNLKALGVGFGPNIDWQQQALTSGSWSTQFTYQMWNDVQFKVYARDSLGAIKESVTTFFVQLDQDDCGFGHDANADPVVLPFSCSGYLSPSSGDPTDSFSFTVPAGSRPHATFTNGSEWGQTLELTSPSGVVVASGTEQVFGTLEAGTWSLSVQGDGDSMLYELSIGLVGPQGPPVLTVLADPNAHQGDEYAFQLRADDPNAERVTFEVTWSDGSGSSWPVGSTAASGEYVTAFRRFLTSAASLSVTVRAINAEGLASDPRTIPVTIRPHNDCGLGIGHDLSTDTEPLAVVGSSCSGTLGGGLLEFPYPIDDQDAFKTSKRCMIGSCKLRLTLTTEPGLAAYMVVGTLPGVQQTSSSCGSGGCTTTMDLLVTYPTSSFPVVSLRRAGGKGGYTIAVEEVGLTDGLL